MTRLTKFHGVYFAAHSLVPKGKQVLLNRGTPVLCVEIGAPIEDAECDEIWLHPDDYDAFMRKA